MKRYILAIAAASLALAASAGESAAADTVFTSVSPDKVEVIESETDLKVKVTESDTTRIYRVDYPRTSHRTSMQRWSNSGDICIKAPCSHSSEIMMGGANLGFIAPLNQDGDYDIETSKSFEITFENFLAFRQYMPWKGKWNSFISVGIGGNWRFYTMTRDKRFIADAAGDISVTDYPEGMTPGSSTINTFSLQFPISWTQELPGKIFGTSPAVTVGAVLNWNTYAAVNTHWTDAAGTRIEASQHGLHQRRFTVDVMAKLRVFPVMSIYARYSPMSIFTPEHGPKISPLTFGITLF